MDDLSSSPVAESTDPTAQLAYDVSDPTLTEAQRSEAIDRYFNELIWRSDRDYSSLQASLMDELAPWMDSAEINRRLEAIQFGCYTGATSETSRQMIEYQGDPVMLFSGQFTHSCEDIRIKGGGMDLAFRRVYKNQSYYRGPLGICWDHNFNMWLREESATLLVRSSGELRDDRYTLHPVHNYFQPPDGFHDVILPSGDSYELVTLAGTRFVYERIPSTALHRLRRTTDRSGNYLTLDYDIDRLLRRVLINSPNRYVTLDYDGEGRIAQISDHAGRTWSYQFDDFGDLIRVVLPPETSGSDRKYIDYAYSTALTSGPTAHNLLSISNCDIGTVVENEYGNVTGTVAFNRVVRQLRGPVETLFEYEDILPFSDASLSDMARPSHLTREYGADGHQIEHLFNMYGHLIGKQETITNCGGPQILISRYRYNADGALVGSLSPEGNVTQYWYARDDFELVRGLDSSETVDHPDLTQSNRMGFGLLLAVVKRGKRLSPQTIIQNKSAYNDWFPAALRSLSPADVTVRYTYEPLFGRALTISDPRVTSNADPRDGEVTNPGDARYAAYHAHLTRYKYAADGTLQRIDYPDTTRPDGSVLTNAADQYLSYDVRGRLLLEANAEGDRIRYEYYDAIAGPLEGYLRYEILDPEGLSLVTEFDYTSFGALRSKRLPGGAQILRVVDAAGRVRRETGPLGFHRDFRYDSEGRCTREEIEVTDAFGAPHPDGPEIRTRRFDALGNLLEENVGGLGLRHVTRHRYDGAGNRVQTDLPNGQRVRYRYDARNLLTAAIRAPCTPVTSITRTSYDGEQRKKYQMDARGFRTEFAYDALGRVIAETDPLGGMRLTAYDALNNETCERFFERRTDGFYLLTRRAYQYDERGRRIRETVNQFSAPLLVTDPLVEHLVDPGPGVTATTEYEFDRLGRIVRQRDPLGNITEFKYDAVGRLERRTDALGNYIEYTYFPNGSLRTETEHSVDTDASGASVGERVYVTTHEYDIAGRRKATVDPLLNRTEWDYDSRGNTVVERDALGNITRFFFDIFGNRVRIERPLTITGRGGAQFDTAIIQQTFDETGRRTSIVDPLGATTQYRYDALGRQCRIEYPDGTWQEAEYDASDNIIGYRDSRGVKVKHTIDALNRKTQSDVDFAPVDPGESVGGTLKEMWAYDGLGRVLRAESDACSVISTYDSVGRVTSDTFEFSDHVGMTMGPLTVRRGYDAVGNRILLTYPNGRQIAYFYDALHRLQRIDSVVLGVGYPGPKGRSAFILSEHFYDGVLLAATEAGNGVMTLRSWDGARRNIELHTFNSAGDDLLRLQFVSDGTGNIRMRIEDGSAGNSATRQYYDSHGRLAHVEQIPVEPLDPIVVEAFSDQIEHDAIVTMLDLPLGNRSFTLDRGSNRLETRGLDASGEVVKYVVIPGNQYDDVGGINYVYDGLGNVSSSSSGWKYTYDYRGRLVGVTDPSGNVTSHYYDANGRLVMTSGPGSTDHVVADGVNRLAVYREGALKALFVNENAADSHCHLAEGGEDYWIHKDQIGSTRVVTDSGGTVAATCTFDPFGITIGAVPGGPVFMPLFMGRPLLRSTGLYDFRSRVYDPVIGRFLQRDGSGTVDGPNLYAAFSNNPLSYQDPLGTESVRQWALSAVEQNIKEGHTITAGAQYVGYFIWNSLTFGFVEKNSDSYEKYSGSDYVLMTIADTGRSAAIMGASMVAGGAVGAGGLGGRLVSAVSQTGASTTVSMGVGGAANGVLGSAAALGAEDMIDVLGTGYRSQPHSVEEYMKSMALGGVIAGVGGAAQGNALASEARANPRGIGVAGEQQASQATGQPRNVGAGQQQRLQVLGAQTPTGRQQVYIPDQPPNPTAVSEGTLATRGTIVEVKTYVVTELGATTANMPKAIAAAQQAGVPLELFMCQATRVSADLRVLIENGQVIPNQTVFPLSGSWGTGAFVAGTSASGRVKPSR